jgi:hypothetical protein
MVSVPATPGEEAKAELARSGRREREVRYLERFLAAPTL